jgi:NagD protein
VTSGAAAPDLAPDGPEIVTCLMDMDGVLVREEEMIPGADRFLASLDRRGCRYRVLAATGLQVPPTAIWTSALATAQFVSQQRPGGSAFAIGEAGLTSALHDVGYTLTERQPDYVVLGETRTYSFEQITRGIRLVEAGARFLATNPDPVGPSPHGPIPATGAVAALITHATGVAPYFIGKPNPLMMRSALRSLEAHSETSIMIGDRMDTDIVAGLEAGLRTVLVLTGVTQASMVSRFPYVPTRIVHSVADLADDLDLAIGTTVGL